MKPIFPLKLSFTRKTQSKFGQPTSVHAYSSIYHETRAFSSQKDVAFSWPGGLKDTELAWDKLPAEGTLQPLTSSMPYPWMHPWQTS